MRCTLIPHISRVEWKSSHHAFFQFEFSHRFQRQKRIHRFLVLTFCWCCCSEFNTHAAPNQAKKNCAKKASEKKLAVHVRISKRENRTHRWAYSKKKNGAHNSGSQNTQIMVLCKCGSGFDNIVLWYVLDGYKWRTVTVRNSLRNSACRQPSKTKPNPAQSVNLFGKMPFLPIALEFFCSLWGAAAAVQFQFFFAVVGV